MLLKITLPLFSSLMAAFAMLHVYHNSGQPADLKPPHELPTAPYSRAIAAHGIVEPSGGVIEVGAPVAGIVAKVFVEAGQTVAPDAPLFRLDDRHLQAQLSAQMAAVAVAKAELKDLESPPRQSEVKVSRARVEEAKAHLGGVRDRFQRAKVLHSRDAASEESLVDCRQQAKVALAQLDRSNAELQRLMDGASEQQRAVARAAVEEAASRKRQIETEIERLTVRSPFATHVLRVNVSASESVSHNMNQPLVILARVDGHYLRVDVDEHDLPRFDPSASASATRHGESQLAIQLRFVRIEPYVVPNPPSNGPYNKVDSRSLEVIYAIEAPPGTQLFVGQQLDVFVGS